MHSIFDPHEEKHQKTNSEKHNGRHKDGKHTIGGSKGIGNRIMSKR